jgi:acyl-coenzyme A thioesterase PaaI-like protein
MQPRELQAFLDRMLPEIDQQGVLVEGVDPAGVRLKLAFQRSFVRHGVFSGPMLLGFADTAMFAAVQAAVGFHQVALMATCSATFVSPCPAADVIAQARVLRAGKRLALAEASVGAAGEPPALKARA